jgi:zinc transport system permease protein
MEFFSTLLEHQFLQTALAAGLLASVGCGIMGTYVVVKRISFIAGGIAHAVLAGMGAAYFFNQSPLLGAVTAALIASWIIGWVNLRWRQNADTLIAALWSVGMAIGIIFISRSPGYNADLMSYLFGNILMVPSHGLILMIVLDVVIIGLVTVFYKQFLVVCFDEQFATLRGLNIQFYYLLLLSSISMTVVLLIQVVGLILVIALLTLPAAIAAQYQGSLFRIMMVAIVLGAVFTTGGLAISYQPDLPTGATIILLAGVSYVASTVFTSVVKGK